MRLHMVDASPLPAIPVGVDTAPTLTSTNSGRWWLNTGSAVAVPTYAQTITTLRFHAPVGVTSAHIASGSWNGSTSFTITDFLLASGLTANALNTVSSINLAMNSGDLLAVFLPSSAQARIASVTNATIYRSTVTTSPSIGGVITGFGGEAGSRAQRLYGF